MMELNQADPAGDDRLYLAGHGGDTSNCAIAAARQGAAVGYITALGADSFGDSFMALWREEGVNCDHVRRDAESHTGLYFVSHGPGGHAFTYLRKGSAASLMTPADLPETLIAGAKILHVSGISQAISDSACDTVFRAIEIARGAGVRTAYDTNLRLSLWPVPRARAVIHAAIGLCDIALPGLDDARHLTGLDDPDAIADFYLGLGPALVALKLGARGALIATPDSRMRLQAVPVDSVDATGAGDVFDGAFLAELLRGTAPVDAGRYANAAAALSTRGFGAVAPIPRRTEVEAHLGAGAPAT
jgi:2-dehydro-3-deoxygluconokinase